MSGAVSVARSVTITIHGTPAYALSPNSRCHWAVKQRETEAAKWDVKMAVAERFCGFPEQFTGPVRLHWTIYLDKGGKRRDMTNILPALKAHEDGLVLFGVIPGDSPRYIPATPTVDQITWSEHKSEPRIVVEITEVS